ncbi:AIM24 family protein [Paenibacillus sp. P96]|uniref:AIM24 family protein n=1 Tax=Paenibacillus zeirhizosphaerae TaxID=2987519 RepID=A0ABT9FWK8_9BACL|nr:AIM24 family protein [Paenibacillus sp. P96]MDP4099005.1 AIM24 family protein [Paenibacillus sp. P96]
MKFTDGEHQHGGSSGNAVTFTLEEQEVVHVLHPQQIIAYRGPSSGRSDKLMNIKGIYRKRKLIQGDFAGPCRFTAALPPGFSLKMVTLADGSDLLYDFKHLFCYTSGIRMRAKVLSMKNMLFTRDAVKIKFEGSGQIGLLTQGVVCQEALHPTEPIYIDARSVIAYPESASLELTVYGNNLASQHMNYHFKMTGRGTVLFQAGEYNRRLAQDLDDESVIKRFLREALPFGGVFIK